MKVALPSVVDVGGHLLALVVPHPVRQLRYVQAWPATDEDNQIRHNFAALAVCLDPAALPPWTVEKDLLAQGDAVALTLSGWVGAIKAFAIASAVSEALYALASPAAEEDVKPLEGFFEAPVPGLSGATSSPTATSETPSPGTA